MYNSAMWVVTFWYSATGDCINTSSQKILNRLFSPPEPDQHPASLDFFEKSLTAFLTNLLILEIVSRCFLGRRELGSLI